MKQFISKSISYGWAAIHHYNPLLNFFVLIGQNALRGTKLDDEYPRGRGGGAILRISSFQVTGTIKGRIFLGLKFSQYDG